MGRRTPLRRGPVPHACGPAVQNARHSAEADGRTRTGDPFITRRFSTRLRMDLFAGKYTPERAVEAAVIPYPFRIARFPPAPTASKRPVAPTSTLATQHLAGHFHRPGAVSRPPGSRPCDGDYGEALATARMSGTRTSLMRGRPWGAPRARSCWSIACQPRHPTTPGTRLCSHAAIASPSGAWGSFRRPCDRSSRSRATVSVAHFLLVPMTPDGPRLIPPDRVLAGPRRPVRLADTTAVACGSRRGARRRGLRAAARPR